MRLGGLGMALLLAACHTPPRGSDDGRLDANQTYHDDIAEHDKVRLPEARRLAEEFAQLIAHDLADEPFVRDAQTKLVLELGTIENHTRTPTEDFHVLQRHLQSRLLSSPLIRDKYLIVDSRRRNQAERDRIAPQEHSVDLLQEGRPTQDPGASQYDPAITYVLSGTFLESIRGSVTRYYLEFRLSNLQSRAIVFQHTAEPANR